MGGREAGREDERKGGKEVEGGARVEGRREGGAGGHGGATPHGCNSTCSGTTDPIALVLVQLIQLCL